jgi:hypothetical protein
MRTILTATLALLAACTQLEFSILECFTDDCVQCTDDCLQPLENKP